LWLVFIIWCILIIIILICLWLITMLHILYNQVLFYFTQWLILHEIFLNSICFCWRLIVYYKCLFYISLLIILFYKDFLFVFFSFILIIIFWRFRSSLLEQTIILYAIILIQLRKLNFTYRARSFRKILI
jgi:hypothetical protein